MRFIKFLNYLFEKRVMFTFTIIYSIIMIIQVTSFINDFFFFDTETEYNKINEYASMHIDELNSLYDSNFDKVYNLYIDGHKVAISNDKEHITIFSRDETLKMKYTVIRKNSTINIINPVKEYDIFWKILEYITIFAVCFGFAMFLFAVLAVAIESILKRKDIN